MARSGVTAFSFAVLLALLEIGSCMRCYQCNSQSDPKCKDPFVPNQSLLVECNSQDSVNFNRGYLSQLLPAELIHSVPGAPRQCHKIVTQSGTTIRTCLDVNPASQTTCNTLKMTQDVTKQTKYCSVCDKDLCNAAGSISVSLPLAFAAAIATYLYSKH
ncbi:UPAR/Ly6 domain-containing protein bero-like [Maniola hyperantus]|uniref:UPAR/Ly6 domain-containing protein bero-like n=1 Tax=Aphantopus hyperantus TaxID=2795564 RepID=UPI001569BC3B|nr:uncharacterized protein LOC117991049 [Maniola hyperantus]